jgi:hypothetical protein
VAGAAVLSEETQPLVLGAAPGGRGAVTFALPQAHAGADLVLEASNGFGQALSSTLRIVDRLVVSAQANASAYATNEAGEIVVTLTNTGNTVHEGVSEGGAPGLFELEPQSFSIPPGSQAVLRHAFTVPAHARSGLHRGSLQVGGLLTASFFVTVRPPELGFSVEDRLYTAGETIPVVLRNAGGSIGTPEIEARLGEFPPVRASASLAVGEETTLEVPIPAHLPSGVHPLLLSARDDVHFAGASRAASVRVAGTAATLSVATDADVYLVGSTIAVDAQVTNAGLPLVSAGLHLEIATPCAPALEGVTFHFDTWAGSDWIERAARGRGQHHETDQVDLSAYWPDPDGEYKVRIRHDGVPPAAIDYVALVSGGALVAPTEAMLDSGGDVLAALSLSDETGADVTYQAVVVRFPPASSSSLLYRAREGDPPASRR